MGCAWNELLMILPPTLRTGVDAAGKDTLQEIRLRINGPPELVLSNGRVAIPGSVTQEELDFVVNAATNYSPWTAGSAAQGYITAPGGHRIGLCGDVVMKNGNMAGLRKVRSLCIRVARDFPGIADNAAIPDTSILILGAPGSGKTTLLRDLIRNLSGNYQISVLDERKELFPEGMDAGIHTDILSGCPKVQGISMLLRTMSPDYLAVDEITDEADTRALIQVAHCGVRLLATAHSGNLKDFQKRAIYQPLLRSSIFDIIISLKRDKTYTLERMGLCTSNGWEQL